MSRARKIMRIGTKPKTQQGKQITINGINPRLETQRRKAKTQYMLEDYLNEMLF
jgi:hypothetical protein